MSNQLTKDLISGRNYLKKYWAGILMGGIGASIINEFFDVWFTGRAFTFASFIFDIGSLLLAYLVMCYIVGHELRVKKSLKRLNI